jgi:hypothetical protein
MFVPMMWSVWGVLVVVTAALLIYRSSLTRDEDDQIYLDDAFNHEKAAQEAIVARVQKIEPALRLCFWLVGAMTVLIVVRFLWSVVAQLLL